MINFENAIQQTTQQRYSSVDLYSTEGRIGRQSYFVFSIILPLSLFLVLASIAGAISKFGDNTMLLSYTLFALSVIAVLLLVVRLTIQRCHDFNVSGKLALFALIPFANIIFALIPGNNGLNSYGEAPQPETTSIKLATIVLSVLLFAALAFTSYYFSSSLLNQIFF